MFKHENFDVAPDSRSREFVPIYQAKHRMFTAGDTVEYKAMANGVKGSYIGKVVGQHGAFVLLCTTEARPNIKARFGIRRASNVRLVKSALSDFILAA